MNHCRLKIWRRAARTISWAAAMAALLGLIASCSSINGLFSSTPESKSPAQGAQNQKRVPLPPLIEDYE